MIMGTITKVGKVVGAAIEGGLGMMRNASLASQELTAAERAAAGRKAAELIKSQEQMKASEALGRMREKGMRRTTTTQADRTRVGGGNIGGAPFSAISEADPAYAGKVWGVMDEGTAARLKNLTAPDTAWTTMLGSANQLKTNPVVFDKLKRGFLDAMKQGNLSEELAGKINRNLELTFGAGVDIRDPKIWKEADTFEKRAALADVMMGQGTAPSKGGVALGGEKSGKGVIFKPTNILKRETEPTLLHTEHGGDVPTFAAGPRLFQLEKESEFRPDLHPGFPTLIKGKDLGVNMKPTPNEVYLPDWHEKFKKDNPERQGPGYYDLALGVKGEGLPSQDLTDDYIRHLSREGYRDGGSVEGFGGGGLAKGIKAGVKMLFADAPQAEALKLAQERAALPPAKGGLGLPKNNTSEQRAKAMGFDRDTYHGSFRDIKKLDPSVGSTESHAGKGIYSTDSAEDASRNYASIYGPDPLGRVERGMEARDKDFRKIHSRMRDETLTPRQQEIILRNTVDADNLGVVYPLKVRSDKSIHLDAPESNPVRIGPFERYDEATDAYVDTPYTAKFNEALDEFRELGGDANPVYEAVQYYGDAIPARDVFNAVKKTGSESGLYDPFTGDIVSGGVAAGDFMKNFGIDEIRHTPQFRSHELNIGKEHTISMNPDNIRSRFAAFDPFRRDAATAALMGVAAPDLLAAEPEKKAGGGKIVKGAINIGKRIMADSSLPALEREANLAKFLEPSKAPMRLYHGTTATEGGKGVEAIRRFKPSKEGALGSGTYLTPSTANASGYSGSPNDEAIAAMLRSDYQADTGQQFLRNRQAGNVLPGQEGGNMLPVYAQIKNPLIIEGTHGDPMVEALTKLGMDEDKALRMVEKAYEEKGYIGKQVQSRAQAQGYDGLMQYRDGELSEVVSYNPNAVKSAIGNQGTYDISQPDLSKAHGGYVNQDAMNMAVMGQKIQKRGKGGNIKKAVKSVVEYIDPVATKISDWEWRALQDVKKDVPITIVPDYVQAGYGQFMKEQAKRAAAGDLNDRDLIKAYLITQSSIGRGGLSHSTATKTGLKVPNAQEVRPEGAFATWLGSPAGQRYLDAAQKGEIDPKSLEDLRQKFAPFGKQNQLVDQMTNAVTTIPSMTPELNLAISGNANDYRDFAERLKGIAAAKSGFIGSLLGRGDLPTFDARQIGLHTSGMPMPTASAGAMLSRGKGLGGREAVDRLAARQKNMDLKIDPSLDPHYQHLTHHAIWDALGGEKTTHQDLIDAMKNYAKGGAVNQDAMQMAVLNKRVQHKQFGGISKAGFGKPQGGGGANIKFRFADGGAASGTNADILDVIAQSKAQTRPSTAGLPRYGNMPPESQFERDFRARLAAEQEARRRVISDRSLKGMAQGAAGALAGYGSQIPGLFGDVASLYQEFKPNSFVDLPAGIQALPTTDDIQNLLREHINDSPEFSAGMTGGNAVAIAQGITSLPALAKGIVKGVPKIAGAAVSGAKSLTPTAAKLFEEYMMSTGMMLPVVKNKGGNFLPEGTKALDQLKSNRYAADDKKMFEAELADLMEQEARTPGRHAARIPVVQGSIAEMDRNIAFNNFIDKQLTRYVKNEMGTPEDPIRALAERGTLHFDAPQVNPTDALDLKRQEFAAGNNEKWGYGESRLAQNWEDASDKMINSIPAEKFQNFGSSNMTGKPGFEFINKLSPDTPLYGLNNSTQPGFNNDPHISTLGFPHLIDELRNATNPASGLPRELLLKPEALARLSVPQAVERVAKINEWRTGNIKQARLADAANTDVHKEYKDTGMRWVLLNKPGQFKAESDAMGHSVRGYEPTEGGGSSGYGLGGWDAIKSGDAEVYSLRDAKNEPHATIEVGASKTLTPEKREAQMGFLVQRLLGEGMPEEQAIQQAAKIYPESETMQRITQIKGKSNRAPNEAYLPYVQDFVKSGKWSSVGDPQNAGLRRYGDVFNVNEQRGIEATGEYVPDHEWLTGEDIQRLHNVINSEGKRLKYDARGNIIGGDPDSGMKRGGPVNLDAMQMAVWGKPVKKAEGGEPTQAEIEAAMLPATVNPLMAKKFAAQRQNMTAPTSIMDERYPASKKAQDEADLFLLGADMATSVAPFVGPLAKGVIATAKSAPEILARGLENYMVKSGGILPMDVWHGSPHRFPPTAKNPLGEFDSSKIGTGEGAQAYGHGLYLAENKSTATGFRDTLAHKGALDLEYESAKRGIPFDREAQIEFMRQSRANVSPEKAAKSFQYANIEARNLDQNKLATLFKDYKESKQGNLYKVDLPDEQIAKMLDFNKPLKDQNPEIQKTLQDLVKTDVLGRPTGISVDSNMNGQWAYERLAGIRGAKYASEAMREAGIPGIKYLDQGSRAGGAGTSNFVVFDPKNLNILERNKRAGGLALTRTSLRQRKPNQLAR